MVVASLRIKMILGISAILVLVVSAYAVIALRAQGHHLQSMVRREAELVGTVAERAIAIAMEEGKVREVQAILERVGQQPDLARIRILDRHGTILRSSQPDDVGRPASEWRGWLRDDGPTARWDATGQRFDTFRPIANAPGCHGCHPREAATLGFLAVSASVPAIDSDLARQWTILILAAVGGLMAAGVLIWAFFTVMVGGRIDQLAVTMSRVEAGDLTVRAPARGGDELARLGESFNAMVANLASARQQLESRHADEIRRAEHLAALGKMAAGVAHEINNPLAGMQNCVRTLLRGARDETQRVQYLEMVREGLERIGRIVSHLLSFAREARPQLAPTSLADVLHRCLALVEHEIATRGIQVSLTGTGDLPPVPADRHQMEQLFLNLVMNAVEAMPAGGRLAVDAAPPPGVVSPVVEIRVRDTGNGIPPQQLSRIFDPFFTTKEVGKGTGLGLSVSYGIVKAHGGSIAVSSTPGAGTMFTVILPLQRNGASHA